LGLLLLLVLGFPAPKTGLPALEMGLPSGLLLTIAAEEMSSSVGRFADPNPLSSLKKRGYLYKNTVKQKTAVKKILCLI
jgi:hypothetical protein